MPSRSLLNFRISKRRALRLLDISTDRRLRPLTYSDMEPGLHAALASFVSAWEAYVESICAEILDEISTIANPQTLAVLSILRLEANNNINKFNTPNFENSRNLILRFTGFDPYNYMTMSSLGLSAQQSQTRLNEILRLRHAFAHGVSIPNLPWITRYGVQSRLSKKNVAIAGSSINDLVKSIDSAASNYLRATYGLTTSW